MTINYCVTSWFPKRIRSFHITWWTLWVAYRECQVYSSPAYLAQPSGIYFSIICDLQYMISKINVLLGIFQYVVNCSKWYCSHNVGRFRPSLFPQSVGRCFHSNFKKHFTYSGFNRLCLGFSSIQCRNDPWGKQKNKIYIYICNIRVY